MDSAPPGWLPERVRWWIAERFGEEPECDKCGQRAHLAAEPGCHYECLSCNSVHWKTAGVAYVRDLKPQDYFGGHDG